MKGTLLIVKRLYEHCTAEEVVGSRIYVHQIPHFLSNYAEANFLSKLRFIWQSVRFQGRRWNVLGYVLNHLLFPIAGYMWHFPLYLHWTTSLLQWMKNIDKVHKIICWQGQRFYLRSVSMFQIYYLCNLFIFITYYCDGLLCGNEFWMQCSVDFRQQLSIFSIELTISIWRYLNVFKLEEVFSSQCCNARACKWSL